jgi:uncharacterized protein YbjT (DUF2867 family)
MRARVNEPSAGLRLCSHMGPKGSRPHVHVSIPVVPVVPSPALQARGDGALCRQYFSVSRSVSCSATLDEPVTSNGPKILLTGSTGGTGKRVAEKLIAAGMTDVACMTRSASKARTSLPAGVEIVEGDLFDWDAARTAVDHRSILIICSGTTSRFDPLDPFKVDFQGVENLVTAAKQSGTVSKIILVSSIGVDDPLFPLNVFGGVLVMKKLGELAVQRSGIDYTIIRPGGLRSKDDGKARNVVAGKANTFGLPPRPKLPGGISRSTVADACLAALTTPEASNKVIEIIEEENAPYKSWDVLFGEV